MPVTRFCGSAGSVGSVGSAVRRDATRVGPLVEARLNLGQTQGEFARLIGVGKGAVVEWEKGRDVPRPGNMRRIAERVGLSVAEVRRWFTGTTAGR